METSAFQATAPLAFSSHQEPHWRSTAQAASLSTAKEDAIQAGKLPSYRSMWSAAVMSASQAIPHLWDVYTHRKARYTSAAVEATVPSSVDWWETIVNSTATWMCTSTNLAKKTAQPVVTRSPPGRNSE